MLCCIVGIVVHGVVAVATPLDQSKQCWPDVC